MVDARASLMLCDYQLLQESKFVDFRYHQEWLTIHLLGILNILKNEGDVSSMMVSVKFNHSIMNVIRITTINSIK